MLRSLKELLGYELLATDGKIGKAHDFLFSDEDWKVRYLIVDTGSWIFGRNVLISVDALGQPVWASKTFPVELSRTKVQNSPDADLAKPVSRQYEEELQRHYRWPAYWSVSHAAPGYGVVVPPHLFDQHMEGKEGQDMDRSHLRSAMELFGYLMNGTDGEVGSVKDFILNDEDWQIHYMVAELDRELEEDKQVLIAIDWLETIDVIGQWLSINLPRETIEQSPAFDLDVPVNRQYEEVLYDYHGRPKYWQVIEQK